MHGLPEQTIEQALLDLKLAVENGATHVSWYQLTIEPNTVFFRTQPILPVDDVLEEIQAQGEAYLKAQGFINYEVSAWRKEKPSAHNLNYWQFGDYLGDWCRRTWQSDTARWGVSFPKNPLAERLFSQSTCGTSSV